jgi:hypothetical protein
VFGSSATSFRISGFDSQDHTPAVDSDTKYFAVSASLRLDELVSGPSQCVVAAVKKLNELLHPALVTSKCPGCKSEIPYFDVKIGFKAHWVQDYFKCRSCNTLLRVSAAYAWLFLFSTMVIAVVIAALLPISWIWLPPVAVVIWFFVTMLTGTYARVLVPPKIEQYYPDELSLTKR